MNNPLNKKILLIVILIVIAAGLLFAANRMTRPADVIDQPITATPAQSMKGCYSATIAKDVYTLTITSDENTQIVGTLVYKNFEKDSSSGTFTGTYQDGMLVGDYVFMSEGMTSVSEKVFKKTDAGFVQGSGDMGVEGDRSFFIDKSTLTFDGSLTFVPVACQ